jgi:S1-C subfamily serine protease
MLAALALTATSCNAPTTGTTGTSTAGIAASSPAPARTSSGLAEQIDPIIGRALLVIPDRNLLRPTIIGGPEGVEAAWKRERAMADAVVRSRVFQAASVEEAHNSRDPAAVGADFVVWYRVDPSPGSGTWSKGWYIRKKDDKKETPIAYDANEPDWTASFAKGVRATALRIGARPMSSKWAGLPVAQPPALPTAPTQPTTRTTYTYDGKQYPTAQAALAAQRERIAATLAGVVKQPEPIAGRARIVLADRDRLRALTSNQADVSANIETQSLSEHETADAIIKAGIFASARIVEQNDTANPELGDDDFIVWFQVRSTGANNVGPWVSAWRVRHKNSAISTQIAFDPGVPSGAPRMNAFLKTLHDAAVKLSALKPPVPGGAAAAVSGSGSGFAINGAGQIVTNNHVVRACKTIRVIDTAHRTDTATVIARDAANDLALLAMGRHWDVPARVRETRTVRAGETVVVTGYPLAGLVGSDMAVTTGSLTALSGLGDDSRIFQVSAPIQPGNSGGPLLDGQGNVIGVVSSTLNSLALALLIGGPVPQNVNFAIKASILRNFLETNSADFASTAERPEHDLPVADVADIGRRFTVKVECSNEPPPVAAKP